MSATELEPRRPEPEAPTGAARARRARRAISMAFDVLLGYAVLVAVLPLNPWMPTAAIVDASWAEAMNKAAVQHLVFGKDIVFTYGPYASVASTMYEPALRSLTLFASACYALAFVYAAAVTTRRAPQWVKALFAAILLGGLGERDLLIVIYPLVAVVALERLTRPGAHGSRRRVATFIGLGVLAGPLGLAPLVKASALPTVGLVGVAMLVVLLRRRWWLAAAWVVLVPLVGGLAAWWKIGQPVGGIVRYVVASLPVMSGYSNAMSWGVPTTFPAVLGAPAFVAGSVLLVVAAFLSARTWERRALALAVTGTLAIAWKEGFVRPDGHMTQAATTLALSAAVVAGLVARPRWRWTVATLAAAACAAVYASPGFSLRAATDSVRADVIDLPRAAVSGKLSPSHLDRVYANAQRHIAAAGSVPRIRRGDTVDLYPSVLAELFARDAHWNPRPVVQSYSAYTAALARLNARHLTSDHAPETVLFQIAPLDYRLPSNDDGASWLPLLEHYDVDGFQASNDYLRLVHRDTSRRFRIGAPVTLTGHYGRPLSLPSTTGGWLARFDVEPTLLGKARSALWDLPPIGIQQTKTDGTADLHTFIPAVAQARVLLSPEVSSTGEFGALFNSPQTLLDTNSLASVEIMNADRSEGTSPYWRSTYTLRLWPIDLIPAG